MWVLFDGGFVSIVRYEPKRMRDKRKLLVRGRERTDLKKFCVLAERKLARIRETPDADYRYRVLLNREEVRTALRKLTDRIDYPNFKDRVADHQGAWRAMIYGEVWASLRKIQY